MSGLDTTWLRQQLERYDVGELNDENMAGVLRRAYWKVGGGRCKCGSRTSCCQVSGHDYHVSPHSGCVLR